MPGGKLRLSSEIEGGKTAWGNGELLRRAVDNYLMNASRHTVSGGRIQAALSQKDERLRFSVYNDGREFPKEIRKKSGTAFIREASWTAKARRKERAWGFIL